MNQKFIKFTNINKDASLTKTKVTAYIADKVLNENDTVDPKGKLVIVDNTDENYPISNLLSEYGFYIDDTFIAGGHGFKTFEDAKKVLDTVNGFENIYNQIEENLEDLNNKIFVVSIGEYITDDSNQYGIYVDIYNHKYKYFDEVYNKYGFITSYKYLDIEKKVTSSNNENIIEYQLLVKEQTNIEYIEDIIIEPNYVGQDYVEIINTNSSVITPFEIKCTIKMSNANNGLKLSYNDDLKVYLKSSTTLNPYQINTQTVLSYIVTKSFDKPAINFEDDLELYIVNGNDEIIYSKVFEGLLKWKDKYTFSTNYNLNDYNFRDNVDFNSIPLISNFITDSFDTSLQTTILYEMEYNKEILLTFENGSNQPSYNYIIFRNSYDVEFYFNNIKSNNWIVKEIGNYFVWQSPQQYMGSHTWKIIIKP